MTDEADGPCPRCAPRIARLRSLLSGQAAELKAAVAETGRLEAEVAAQALRLSFRPCGYTAPGAALCEVTMPDGRITRGRVCAAHAVLLMSAGGMAVSVLGAADGPCGWLVPAEESCMPAQDGAQRAVTA